MFLTVHLHEKFRFDSSTGFVLFWSSPAAAHGVDLVDEDGCGSVEPGLRSRTKYFWCYSNSWGKASVCVCVWVGDVWTHHFEQQAHKFLWLASVFGGERRGGDVEEGGPTFCSYSFRKQSFSRPGRADHQHTLLYANRDGGKELNVFYIITWVTKRGVFVAICNFFPFYFLMQKNQVIISCLLRLP